MPKISNSQNVQIKGSSGVTIGAIEQHVSHEPEAESEPVTDRVRVLFLAANPAGTVPLRLDREVKAIDHALNTCGSRDRFEIEQTWLASSADLQQSLLRFSPQILHFSGHGEEESIVLERSAVRRHFLSSGLEEGGMPLDLMSANILANVIALAGSRLTCVLLNACHSEATAQAIARHVDFVIGTPAEIEDTVAIHFAWSFYHALGSRRSIRTAFELACEQAKHAGASVEAIPRLFASGASQDTALLK